MNQLEEARQIIDEVDREMARLYERRMDAVTQVLQYKKENQLPILDTRREKNVIQKNIDYIENPKYKPFYKDVMRNRMRNSREYQQTLLSTDVVAYAGVKGAFGHLVSDRLFPGNPKKNYSSFDEVFQAVVDRKAQYGVIPFENTNSGLVGEVLDGLMQYPVYIQRMADQRIEQCLLGVPGASLKDIEYVYSKDQALAQSKEFLSNLHVQTVAYPNTAMAAQYVANEKDVTKAAIGAKENAEIYNLDILATGIEPDATNTTRFLVIGLEPSKKGDHSSFLLAVTHTSGTLAKSIETITKYGLNMDSIQSRPRKGRPFEYFFFIEVDSDLQSENAQKCIEELKKETSYFRVLGNYPIDMYRKDED